MDTNKFNIDNFRQDLAEEVAVFVFMLGNVLGEDKVEHLLGKPGISMFGLQGNDIDLDNLSIGVHGNLLYDYAINARLSHGWSVPNIDDSLRAIDVICRHNIEIEGGVLPSVEMVWRKAFARAKLDSHRCWGLGELDSVYTSVWVEQEAITIEDVAYLCDMTPASVRNSTTKNAKDRLHTKRKDGKVTIDEESLMEWLKRRRTYLETELIEIKAEENANFQTVNELGLFLSRRIMNCKPSVDDLSKEMGISETAAQGLALGGTPDLTILGIDTLIGAAKLLDLVEGDFIQRGTRILLDQKLKDAGLLPKGEVILLRTSQHSKKGES